MFTRGGEERKDSRVMAHGMQLKEEDWGFAGEALVWVVGIRQEGPRRLDRVYRLDWGKETATGQRQAKRPVRRERTYATGGEERILIRGCSCFM